MLTKDNPKIITTKSMIQSAEMDIKLGRAYYNLSVPSLVEVIIKRKKASFRPLALFLSKPGSSPADRQITGI